MIPPSRSSGPFRASRLLHLVVLHVVVLPLGLAAAAHAQAAVPTFDVLSPAEDSMVPDLDALEGLRSSSLAPVVERFTDDRRALGRRYDADGSPERRRRLLRFYDDWSNHLDDIDFQSLGPEARLDWILLRSVIDAEVPELEREGELFAEMAELLPFADPVFGLHETRRQREDIDSDDAAGLLAELTGQIEETRKALERGITAKRKREQAEKAAASGGAAATAGAATTDADAGGERGEETEDEGPVLEPSRVVAHRAQRWTGQLRGVLKDWYEYRNGYDPLFTWWVREPYEALDKELEGYAKFLKEKVLEIKEDDDAPIIGDPIGRDALLVHLRRAFIAYTPEELIEIAERDLEWGISEMKRAAVEMGFAEDNWKDALEKVKTLHVEPGDQPRLVRDLAHEAIDFLEERDLLTIPPLAREIWRIEMMSPERQKMNPFFLGGEVIRVSFPTDSMTNEEKQMSMRGNNIHFARATVHHELIPGHHLQGFMNSRYNSHRRAFSTPFWTEGWALYWELRLWDLGFPQTPEDRIGMLFWRMHRDTRVIWSLKFHLGEMSAEDCVDFLVDRIGHERENALAEVRRSLEGRYSPIYQLAYLMGGFQFRELQRELVESGTLDERTFHDAILRGGPMPVELVRARLSGAVLDRDFEATWRYAEE